MNSNRDGLLLRLRRGRGLRGLWRLRRLWGLWGLLEGLDGLWRLQHSRKEWLLSGRSDRLLLLQLLHICGLQGHHHRGNCLRE